ncbi:MAG TPA: flippase [Candidatus Rifleibacterium sp.]|nr:flippase [Candidatus Rifleibacterium sp.]
MLTSILRFLSSTTVKKIVINIFWLSLDKVIRFGVGLFVGVWVARYLGPNDFGFWNYAVSFSAIFGAFANLGLDSILVRDLVYQKQEANELLGTAFYLKFFAGLLAILAATLSAVLFVESDKAGMALMVFLSSLGFVFQSLFVIDFFFQSKINSKYSVYAQNISFLLVSMLKIYLIYNSGTLKAFSALVSVEMCLSGVFLLWFYQRLNNNVLHWRYSFGIAKNFLKDSWPLIVTYMAYIVYTRIDQLMIGTLMDSVSVGIYAAAYRIYELPLFFVMVFAQSVSPTLIRLHSEKKSNYIRYYELLSSASTVAGYLLLAMFLLFSDLVVTRLYGIAYQESSGVLKVLAFAQVFMFNAFLRSAHLTINNKQFYLLISTILAAFFNILLNTVLIPSFGLTGAAWATVATQAFSLLVVNGMFRETRDIFIIQIRAFTIYPFFRSMLNGFK